MGETFRVFKEMKRKEKEGIEPGRISHAYKQLQPMIDGVLISGLAVYSDTIVLTMENPQGTITLWPYTGWYQGQKPYGKTKGRGIKNLIKQLKGYA